MGSSASVRYSDPSALDSTVSNLLQISWDRIHIRAHYAEVKAPVITSTIKVPPKKIHGEIAFRVVGGGGGTNGSPILPVEHEMLQDTESPSQCVFISGLSDVPVWNESGMLLYRRDGTEVPTSSPATRKLKITLKDIVDVSTQMEDFLKTIEDKTVQVTSAILTQRLRHRGYKRRHSLESHKSLDNPNLYLEQQIDLPMPEQGWVHTTLHSDRAVVHISVRTSFAEDMISSSADITAIEQMMTSHCIDNLSGDNKALLRCVSDKKTDKAIFWLHGMVDSFRHPRAVKAFLKDGYDVWLLNLRRTGTCRREFPCGSLIECSYQDDYEVYYEEIDKALLHILTLGYNKIFGYSHSTGSSIILDYISKTHRRDSSFKGFIFNSPFLGWGSAGSNIEALADHGTTKYPDGDMAASLKAVIGHKSGEDKILAVNPRLIRVHSLYQFDYRTQTIAQDNITSAFNVAHAAVNELLHSLGPGTFLTRLPYLVLTSRQDHSLVSDELLEFSKKIGPRRTVIQMEFAEHDTIASYDIEKAEESLSHIIGWLRCIN